MKREQLEEAAALATIHAAYEAATGAWTRADWTHEATSLCDSPRHDTHTPCPDCPRGDADGEPVYCEGGAQRMACQTCRDAEAAAAGAEDAAAEAMACVEEGDWRGAVTAARRASSLERAFGDDPTWRPFLQAVVAAVQERDHLY